MDFWVTFYRIATKLTNASVGRAFCWAGFLSALPWVAGRSRSPAGWPASRRGCRRRLPLLGLREGQQREQAGVSAPGTAFQCWAPAAGEVFGASVSTGLLLFRRQSSPGKSLTGIWVFRRGVPRYCPSLSYGYKRADDWKRNMGTFWGWYL